MQKFFKLSAERMRIICGVAESRIFRVTGIETNMIGGAGFDAFVTLDSGDGWYKGAYMGQLAMFAARGEFVTEAEYLAQDAAPAIDTVRAEQVAQQNIAAPLPVCVPGAPLPAAFIVFTSWSLLSAVHPTVAAEFELRRVADGPVFAGAIYPVRVVAPDNVWIGEPCATQEEAERAALAHLREPVEKNRYWITACNERGQVTVNHLHDAATEGEAREWAYRHVAREQRGSICVTLHSRAGRAPITVSLAKRAAPECVAHLVNITQESNAAIMARAVAFVRDVRLTAEYLAAHDGDDAMECDHCGCEKAPGTIDGLCADCRHDEDNHAAIVARDNRDPMATEHCETCGCALESGQIGDCDACQQVKA